MRFASVAAFVVSLLILGGNAFALGGDPPSPPPDGIPPSEVEVPADIDTNTAVDQLLVQLQNMMPSFPVDLVEEQPYELRVVADAEVRLSDLSFSFFVTIGTEGELSENSSVNIDPIRVGYESEQFGIYHLFLDEADDAIAVPRPGLVVASFSISGFPSSRAFTMGRVAQTENGQHVLIRIEIDPVSVASVEASDKLPISWGALKRR